MRIHNIFHSNLLLPYKEMEAYGPPLARPLPNIKEGEEEYKIKLIINARRTGQGHGKLQYLIHWKEYPYADNS